MVRRRKAKAWTGLGDSIVGALREAGLTDHAKRLRIYLGWEAAVGPKIAAVTEPDTFRRGVLLVRAKSPTWQNELTFLKADILAKLNAMLGEELVREIKVVSGTFSPRRPAPPPPPRKTAPSPAAVLEASKTAATIEDPELRDTFARIYASHLSTTGR